MRGKLDRFCEFAAVMRKKEKDERRQQAGLLSLSSDANDPGPLFLRTVRVREGILGIFVTE